MPTDRVLADFIGDWLLEREISQGSGPQATFSGTARWVMDAAGTGAAYSEAGTLRMADGTVLHAERRYRWNDDLSVWFDDGRLFHNVPRAGGTAHHYCDPDTYEGTYSFEAWPAFCVTWNVHGPRKSYRMRSVYTRAV